MTRPASSLMISFAAAGAIELPIVRSPVKKQMANDDGIRISPAPWLWRPSRLSQILAQRHNASPTILLQPKHFLRSEEHTSELQSHSDLVCRLLLEKKKVTDNH